MLSKSGLPDNATPVWMRQGSMVRPRRLPVLLSALCVILAVSGFLVYRHSNNEFKDPKAVKVRPGGCDGDLTALRTRVELPRKVQYARRRIVARPSPGLQQPSIVDVDQTLLTGFVDLNLEESKCSLPYSGEPISIEYPDFRPPTEFDTSNIMFGMSTQLGRVRGAIPFMERWLGNASAQVVINVHDNNDLAELEEVQNEAERVGINAELIQDMNMSGGEDWHAQRHFDLVKTLYKHRGDKHQWFGIVDDDTFFPSLPALLEALKRYDPMKPYYVGELSESWTAISEFYGYMAYGGGGMFLSRAMIDALYEKFDECSSLSREGDSMYSMCIYQKLSPPVQLTRLSGLHQLDLRNDPSGWYEGGVKPMLSLHHFRSWHLFPVEMAHLVTDLCGHECFLQRYRFADDTVLTNAFSIAHYPNGLQNIDLYHVEGTFEHAETDFDFSLGSLRPALSTQDKISYRLEYSTRETDGRTRQFYVRRAGEPTNDGERLGRDVEAVFELEWSK